ncbi:TPR-like protein [Imleria badia]|nr:TPR-like protein [Imleria badia]
MHLLLGNLHMESQDYQGAIQSFERVRAQARPCVSRALLVVSLISGWKFDDFDITIRQRHCEALYAAGHIKEAGKSLLDIVDTINKDVYTSGPIITWGSGMLCYAIASLCVRSFATDFLQRYLSNLQCNVDITTPTPLLRGWAKLKLTGSSWEDALVIALNFTAPRFTIYRALCDHLEMTNRMTEAIECYYQMGSELVGQTNAGGERAKWAEDFTQRCAEKLERLGDVAADAHQHDEAITQYSIALSLNPVIPQGVLMKRSKVYIAKGSWEDALEDANKIITLDPSSPYGYEWKHAALHGARRYDDAICTFETMLLKLSLSPDPAIRERHSEYVNPEQTKAEIRAAIVNAIFQSPPVLINTDSGHLLDESGQTCSFESQPIFKDLISSMTTHVDHARIELAVAEYYRYATFSHKWGDNEPLFEKVMRTVVYDLEKFPTHDKLKMFCKVVRDSGFHWAWSDTCCINKADPAVLQEALVSMFKWYEGSAVTIVVLRGVRSPSKRRDLVDSIWNKRAWTLQEYHASKVVRFYTEDWKPYLNLDIPNHKESPEIISEMEEATGVSARTLMALRPGLDDIRQKLRLASARQTTRVEDSAYSLLGMFSMFLPVVYGEGDQALGRLLAQLLTSSGDTSILAWSGQSGSFNSCLPASITVFNHQLTTHIPLTLEHAEMDKITARLRNSSVNLTLITEFYDRLHMLSVPLFAGQRLKLPCLNFKLGPLSTSWSGSNRIFRAQTAVGAITIETKDDLTQFGSLYFAHPWIDFLLDRQPVGSGVEPIPEETTDDLSSPVGELPSPSGSSGIALASPQTRAPRLRVPRFRWPFSEPRATSPRDAASLRPPSSVSQTEKQLHALQVIARLTKPFGALLLTPHLGNVAAYRRIAAESQIRVTVEVEEITPTVLNKLLDSLGIVDIL